MALTQIPINNEQFNETMDSRIKNEQTKQKYDKTVTAEIIDVTQAKQGKYFVKDENLTQYWVYSSNTDYQEGDQVYITIPQSDYAKDKIIVNKKLVDNSTNVKTRGNYLTNFIDFTGNLISSLNYNYNIEDKDQLRWLKTKTTTYLYTSVEVDIQALQDNLSNKDILNFKDQIGAKIIIKYNDNSSATLDFLINDFLGCLYNTRVLGNYEQYFLQEKVFSIKNLKPENIKGFEWQWVFNAYDLIDKIRIKYRDPQIKIGCSKEEFDNEDRITLYTVEDFKDNKFYSGASNNNEKQTEATFFIEWLHLDENTNTIKNFKTIPSQNYKILWYKYAKNNLATKNDKYSTVNWPRNAGQLEELINNYKSLYVKLNNALDKIIMNNSSTSQQDYNNFSTAVTNTYESDFKNQFQELISSMNNELNKVNQIADQDTLFNNNLFDGDNNFISQYIELITIEDDEERVVEKNNLTNLYSNKINSYLNIPNNLFSMTVPLNINLGATGARVVVLYCDQPLLSSIYTNEIILQNGDTSGLGRNEYGNPLTIVPSDGTSGIYNLYSLSGSLRNLDDATKIRELNVYYEGKKITDDEIIDIVWDIPNNNTMIKSLEEVLYDGQNRGNDNSVYYYNNTNDWTALPLEGTTLKEKKENTGLNIETLYIKTEEDKYVPIKYLSVPEYFTTESADDKFINKRVIKYTSMNNGIIAKPGEDFEYNATYKIENFYNENNHQLNCLYQINDFLNRALTNNYISVGVTFKDGSYCQGGIDLRFGNAGTNGSPFNFYLTVSNNNYPVLTLVDNGNNVEEELIIEAHLEDTENGTGINLLQGTINPAITWKLNHNSESGGAEYVKITEENDSQLDVINNVSSIKIKQNKNLSNAKSTLIMGNKTVLEATVEYGGYHLDTFLPIALRTDSCYKKLKGTTDLYYNSANGVQFNSEAFMPYELYKEIDNQGIITTEGIKYIINPNIQWETLLELPSKKENNEYDFEIYYSWNDQLLEQLPNLNNNNLLQDNGDINNFSSISTQSSGNSLLNNFKEKIINFIKNIFDSGNNNNHIIYGVSTNSNDSNILSNLSTKIEPNCLLKLSNNLDLTLYINYIEGINFYYIKKDEGIENFPDIIDGNNYNTIIESKKLEKEIEQDNYIEYAEEEQPSRYYHLYPLLNSSLKELKEYCDNYQKNSFNVFTQKKFNNNNNNLSYVIYENQGGFARFFPIPIKDEQEDTFYSYYWPKIELNDSLDQNILKLDNYYFVDYTNSQNYLNQYCVVAIDNQGNVLWSQPILQIRNLYPSAVVNNWNGKVEISEEQGTVMAPMIVAGTKNTNNTFSGVILGAPQGDHDDSMSYTGIYGYGNGVQTYGFRADGTAFIGATSGGQINFNGNESVIQSGNYEVKYEKDNRIVTGTKIDLDDGTVDSKYMTLENNKMTLGEASLGQIVFDGQSHTGKITSNNYITSNGKRGLEIDVKNGSIKASQYSAEICFKKNYIKYAEDLIEMGRAICNGYNFTDYNSPKTWIDCFRKNYIRNIVEIIPGDNNITSIRADKIIEATIEFLNKVIEELYQENKIEESDLVQGSSPQNFNDIYILVNNKDEENVNNVEIYFKEQDGFIERVEKIKNMFPDRVQNNIIEIINIITENNRIISIDTDKQLWDLQLEFYKALWDEEIENDENADKLIYINNLFQIYDNFLAQENESIYVDFSDEDVLTDSNKKKTIDLKLEKTITFVNIYCLLFVFKIYLDFNDFTIDQNERFIMQLTMADARELFRINSFKISENGIVATTEQIYNTQISSLGFYVEKYKKVLDDQGSTIITDPTIVIDLTQDPSVMESLFLNSYLVINLQNSKVCGYDIPQHNGSYNGQLYFRIED